MNRRLKLSILVLRRAQRFEKAKTTANEAKLERAKAKYEREVSR